MSIHIHFKTTVLHVVKRNLVFVSYSGGGAWEIAVFRYQPIFCHTGISILNCGIAGIEK